ncbi:MAG: hypothetical protein H0U54_19785 [Acidobacteria bacterium]|nr:hypothetical protein [Acidobacteriota bacterium]
MRRTLMTLSLLLVACLFIACGERSTTVTNASANSSSGASTTGASTNGGQGGSAGSGPQNQGIGGTSGSNSSVVNGNTYTVPPGFNNNGDRGSASNVSNKP